MYDIEVECGLNYMEFERFRSRGMDSVEYTFRKARLCALEDAVESYYFDAMVAYEALAVLAFPYDRVRQGNVKVTRELAMYMYQNGKDSYLHDKVLAALMASLAGGCGFQPGAAGGTIPRRRAFCRKACRLLSIRRVGTCALPATPTSIQPGTGGGNRAQVGKTFGNTLSLMEQYRGWCLQPARLGSTTLRCTIRSCLKSAQRRG